jgi:PAS domain S-box-containing protein
MMRWLRDLSLRWQLLGAFGLVLAIVAGQSVFAYRTTRDNRQATAMVEHTLTVINQAEIAVNDLTSMQTGYRGFLLTGEDSFLDPYTAGKDSYQVQLDALERLTADNPPQIERWREIAREAARWQQEITQPGIALRRQVSSGGAAMADVSTFVAQSGGQSQFEGMEAVARDAIATERTLLATRTARADAANSRLQSVLVAGTVTAIILGLALAWFLSQRIASSMTCVASVARRIANGELDQRIRLNRGDEIGQTSIAFDRMADHLQTTVNALESAVQRARDSEARMQAVLDNIGEGIFTFDSDRLIRSFNPAAERIFGYRETEIVGCPVSDLVPALASPETFDITGASSTAAEAVAGFSGEVTAGRQDHREIPIELDVTEMTDGGERCFIGVARDITDRKQAAADIARERDLLQQLMDSVPDLIFIKDTDSRFLHVNRAFAAAVGVADPLDAIGKTDADFFPHEWAKRFLADEHRIIETGLPLIANTEPQIGPNGEDRWLSTNKSPLIDRSGKIAGLVGTSRDITQRIELEKALREGEERYRLLYGAAERQGRELALVGEVRTALERELDIRVIFRTVVDTIARTFGYSHVSCYTLDDDALVLQHQTGYAHPLDRLPIDRGVIGQVARTGEPALIVNGRDHPEMILADERVVAEICVPLRDEDRVVALLNVESTSTSLSDVDLRLMTGLAEQINVALSRAYLFKRAREGEARFTAFMDHSPAPAWMKDDAFRYVYTNRMHQVRFDITADDISGKDDFQLFPEETAQELRSNDVAVLSADAVVETVESILGPDGIQQFWTVYKFPFQDPSGQRFVGGMAIDVTEQKQAAAQLRETESRFRTLVEQIPAVTYVENVDQGAAIWAITYISPQIEQMLGYSREEWIGDPDLGPRLLHPDDRDRVLAEDERTEATGERFSIEYRMRARDGRTVWIRDEAVLVRDEHGSAKYWQGIMVDVTELQQAALEIQRQYVDAERAQSETNAILDAAGDAIIMISPDRTIKKANRRFGELFEIDPTSLAGYPIGQFRNRVVQTFSPEVSDMLRDGLGDGERRFSEIVTQRWPVERELDLSSTPVHGGDGSSLGRLFTFRDVTREREVDRMKTDFVSLVSHELRTPLTSIKGYVDLLLDGEVGELEAEQQEFLGIVRNNAERLVGLINDLLDISRIEAGKVDLNRTMIDLSAVAERVATSFRPQIEAKQQRLTLDFARDLPPISADADRITQVLTNLLSNAYKYTPSGGELHIAVSATNGQARIDVRDSGIGLTPEEHAQLFTKFFRARNRTTQEVGGTGLGLAITQSLVESHGGTISVKSAPGEGSTFTVCLPMSTDTSPGRGDAHESVESPPAGGRILVVEDDADISGLIRRYLERAGYQVVLAGDATTALKLARDDPPDMVLLDLLLPDADGFTVLEWLKSNQTTTSIPVLILSMRPDDGKGRELGAVDYLTKPLDEEQILRCIRDALPADDDGARPILVADDDDDTRRLVAGHLGRAGYQVVEARDGDAAIALARQQSFALILLDVRMPGTDGIAVLRTLRDDDATRACPIIMMTGSPGVLENGAGSLRALGVTHLLRKPFSAEELVGTIARQLVQSTQGATV